MYASSCLMVIGTCSALLGGGLCATSADRQAVVEMLLSSRPLNLVRPDGTDNNGTLVVNISYSLTMITSVYSYFSRMSSSGYLALSWVDPRLAFQARDVQNIKIDSSKIWTPDIELYNAISPGMQLLNRKDLALVHSSGLVQWVPQVSLPSSCTSATNDTSSTLTCRLRFGSWLYDALEIDLRPQFSEVNLSEYYMNEYYSLVSTSVRRQLSFYVCCPEPYVTVDIIIELERRNSSK